MSSTTAVAEIVKNLVCPVHGSPLDAGPGEGLSAGVPAPDGALTCPSGCSYPVRGGIPRFTERGHYANAFGLQWQRYQRTQLDSYSGVPISRTRLERCLGMPLEGLEGLNVLECGAGAGRFTEHLVAHSGSLVSLDLSDAVDANLKNCQGGRPYLLVQADVNRSPLPKGFFDVVVCLGVLQHTPSPEEAVASLVAHLKPGGLLVIDHYDRKPGLRAVGRYLTLAYPIRAVFKRLPPEAGLKATMALTAVCDPVRRLSCRVHWLDRIVSRLFPSVCYYRLYPELDPKIAYEWNELDTHDTLTDYYQHWRTPEQIRSLMEGLGVRVLDCRLGGIGVEARGRKGAAGGTGGGTLTVGDPRPTVCQVLFTLHVGGAEVLASRLAERLSGDYRFLFACLDGVGPLGDRLRADGFPVHDVGRKPGGLDWRCARRLGALLRAERVDVVHAHQHGPFLYSLLARLPYRRPAVVFTEHGRFHPDHPDRRRMAVNRLLLGRRDRLVGVGRGVGRALVDNEGLPPGRIEVIPNGIPADDFSGVRGDRAAVRAELGLGPDDLVILQAARLTPIKDHATAVRALKRVAAVRPDARLLIAGEGGEGAALDDLIRREGLGANALRLGTRGDVSRLLGAADLVMLTSLKEGIPLALIEGMAAGLPVVATRVGGIPEVVDEGVTGLLAPVGDDAGLADAVLRLAADPGLRDQMGRAGRERAVAVFSESRMHAEYDLIYRDLAARAGSPSRRRAAAV